MDSFDAIVIGSGTSAYYCANGLLEAGKSVCIVDARPFGGTCALRGCQPKKYLVANAEAIAHARHLVGQGIRQAPECDWAALQTLMGQFLDGRSEREFASWSERGARAILGQAVLSGPQEVTVGEQRLSAETIVLATGASPRRSGIPGSDLSLTSDGFLRLEAMPEELVFIGGGYISFEFAHVAARAGARKVTILELSEQPMPMFEPELVKGLIEAGKEAGIEVAFGQRATEIVEIEGGRRLVRSQTGQEFAADCVIEAIGRVPNLSVLEGGAGEVDASPRGITVNGFQQSTSNPHVYAIGDCANTQPMLATVADLEGKAALRNILEGNVVEVDRSVIPSAAFTIPALASVGKSEVSAESAGLNFEVHSGSTSGWASAKRTGEAHGAYKVLLDPESQQVLGAHLLGNHSAEVINVFALAIKKGISATELAEFPWAYPTATSELKKMVTGGRKL